MTALEYFVTRVGGRFTTGREGSRLVVALPEEGAVGPVDRDAPAGSEDTFLWVAGGGAYVINNRFLPLVRRSADAPTNPNKLTISTGLSSSYEEMKNPLLLMRELFEEVVLMDGLGRLLLPCFRRGDAAYALNGSAAGAITGAASMSGIPFAGTVTTSAITEHGLLSDTVEVVTAPAHTVTNALVHIGGAQRMANILYAVHLPEVGSPADLTFYDTELASRGQGVFEPLRREVYIYDLRTDSVFDAADLKQTGFGPKDLTAHAGFLVENLKSEVQRHD